MEQIGEAEFHSFFAGSKPERQRNKKGFLEFLPFFKDCRSIADLGCGEGIFLELLLEVYPQKKTVGVELNEELIQIAKNFLPLAKIYKEDVLSFVLREHQNFEGFIMSDLIEHLEFGTNLAIMNALPEGAILFIKTPNINSLLGQQYYLQTPGHKNAYSPFVLKKMLERTGFLVLKEGEHSGILVPRTLLGKIRRKILRLLFIDEFSRFFGAGNYFVVAKKRKSV